MSSPNPRPAPVINQTFLLLIFASFFSITELEMGYDHNCNHKTTASFRRRCRNHFFILFVTYLFHPVNHLTIKLFLRGNVRHTSSGSRTMPMLFAWQKPNNITRMNFLNRSAFTLG